MDEVAHEQVRDNLAFKALKKIKGTNAIESVFGTVSAGLDRLKGVVLEKQPKLGVESFAWKRRNIGKDLME